MSEWWTYRLADLLMFSAKTYYRLFERYNTAVWPAQCIVLAIGGAIFLCALRSGARGARLAAILLAACWLWVAWAFFWQRYATINWAANYFAAAFLLQALLLLWLGGQRTHPGGLAPAGPPRIVGAALLGFAVLVFPALAPLSGRPWQQAEIFGIAPDPTALATLGVLLVARAPWQLWPLPLLWCAVSAATLYTMQSADAWVVGGCALAALLLSLAQAARRRRLPTQI